MAAFCSEYILKALNKEPNCLIPSCIVLFLTNSSICLEGTLTIETGLSDFHKLIITVPKVKHEKVPLRLYNTETKKILTQQDFMKNFQWGLLALIWIV